MDRRFLIALLLTAVVVVITPVLFPSPKPIVSADSLRADSVRADSLAHATRGAGASGAAATGSSSAPAGLAPGASNSQSLTTGTSTIGAAPAIAANTPDSTAVGRVDTTTIVTPHVTYAFTSMGAAPVAVRMNGYRVLRPGAAPNTVPNLVRAGEPALHYRLVLTGSASRDTIDLGRVPFAGERTPDGVRYSATVPTSAGSANVEVRYQVVADSFIARTTATVTGLSAPAFLLIDLPRGLESSEADTLDDLRHLAFAVKPLKSDAKGIPFDKLDPGEQRLQPGPISWAVAKSKYFLVAILAPDSTAAFSEVAMRGGPRTGRVATNATATVVAQVSATPVRFDFYTGPQEWKRLHAIGREFENANPYGGWLQGIVQPFATLVIRTLLWMKDHLGLNYGWVLVIFGVAVRLLMWPLNQSAMRSSMRMQAIQPEMQEIQKKYANDPEKNRDEMMKLYQRHGMSPFSPLLGCLPMMLPMPIFFALFFVFQNTIEFRGVPFLWFPDISLHDPLYIIPILMGISMYALSWIGMRNAPPNPQATMMSYMLPVMFTFFLVRAASGLNLYYFVQNLAALPQQLLIARERKAWPGATTTSPPAAAAKVKPA